MLAEMPLPDVIISFFGLGVVIALVVALLVKEDGQVIVTVTLVLLVVVAIVSDLLFDTQVVGELLLYIGYVGLALLGSIVARKLTSS